MNAFDRAWSFLQRSDIEGGAKITDDPDDPGGLTKWGVSQRAYPKEDIRALTEDRAKFLFRRDYWDRAGCAEFPPALGMALMDCAVNQGVRTAVTLLQEALRVDPDGIVGPDTIAAANKRPPSELVNEFLSRRLVRYADGKAKYRRGWMLRVLKLKDAVSAV